MRTFVLTMTILIGLGGMLNAQKKKGKKRKKVANVSYTDMEKPFILDSIMHVSVYPTVKVKENEIPIKMKNVDFDLVKNYKIAKKGKDISSVLQKEIDRISASGGGKIHVSKGDYYIGNIDLRSNVHLMIDKDVILRPTSSVFNVGSDGNISNIVKNVSIQGVGGRFKVLLPKEMNGFGSKFIFIRSKYVKNFYYANFDIYDHKTTVSSLTFGPADKNKQNFIGPTHGLVMNITVVDAHYGYGLVQAQAGENIRFYNLHGIGGITLRMETGLKKMNKAQFGGVFYITGKNISIANGHGGILCGAHGMTNGIANVSDVTAFSSGCGYSIGDGTDEIDGVVYKGTFAKGTSINNVTAIFGFNAQIKTKELWRIPEEYLPLINKPGKRGIIENSPSHSCVKIAVSFPVNYDPSTFISKGFKYGNPINITEGKVKDEKKQKKFDRYIKEKYSIKKNNSKKQK